MPTKKDIITEERSCKYEFTLDELRELGQKLAESVEHLAALDADKKRTVKDFDARITAAEAQQGLITNAIRSGYEYRTMPVEVHFDTPKAGMKTIYRQDTQDKVCVEAMTLDEQQRNLPLDEQPTDQSA